MKELSEFEKYAIDIGLGPAISLHSGSFLYPMENDKNAFIISTKDRRGWNHVSIHLQNDLGECITKVPSHEDMQVIRNLFFNSEDLVQEFHPEKKDYINNHSYTLHLWESTEEKVEKPNSNILSKNTPSRIIHTPNQKTFNIRFSDEENYERLNVRCVNKKLNVVKRYPTWVDMSDVKKLIYGEDIACVQFRYSDLNKDYSIDIYKPKNKKLLCPPSILVGSKKFGKIL